ncbi:MFS transporter [Desulfovibrio sp. OttesenSCG-928-F07]|nr:MFS transporter [Desulfovibrio sp. OttesenSCG-928-F07]
MTGNNRITVFGMAGCYALGNFTDNFFKQAAILMAVSLTELQSLAAVLFTLPFILFSAWAGWLADRVQKRNIVIGAKFLELIALSLGAVALWQAWWPGILAVVFIMALQSTIFNPALNGAIPESFTSASVPRVNSLIRLASTAAILAGMATAGVFLDLRPGEILPNVAFAYGESYGRLAAGLFAVCVSIIGVLTAFTLKSSSKSHKEHRAFPWSGPVESFKHVLECRKDRQLFTVMCGDAFFYGLAAIALISIANLAKHLGYSDTLAGLLSAFIMIGIAIGSLIAGRYSATSWRTLMVPALSGLGLFMFLCSLTPLIPATVYNLPLQSVWFAAMLLLAGICGGIFIIPITSFIQIRPAAGEKGKVISASNFLSFSSMALCSIAFAIIGLLPAALTFSIYGILCFIVAWLFFAPRLQGLEDVSLKDKAASPLGAIVKIVLSLRYKVKENGLEQIKASPSNRPLLFLPNHPALIDPLIVYSRISGLKPRALSDKHRMGGLVERIVAKALRVITIPDPEKDGRAGLQQVKAGLAKIAGALNSGDNILLYPSGKIYRSKTEKLGTNSAVARILAEAPEARIILVRTKGLWGSSFSCASGKLPDFFSVLLRHIPAILGNFIFLMPRRRVSIEFVELTKLPANKIALNKELESFYNQAEAPAFKVPLHFLQGSNPSELPEPLE